MEMSTHLRKLLLEAFHVVSDLNSGAGPTFKTVLPSSFIAKNPCQTSAMHKQLMSAKSQCSCFPEAQNEDPPNSDPGALWVEHWLCIQSNANAITFRVKHLWTLVPVSSPSRLVSPEQLRRWSRAALPALPVKGGPGN